MDKKIIEKYNSQYNNEGGCWNKKTCFRDGKIETYSGPGSLLENTDLLVENLNNFIKTNNIKSIIDMPCGDFNYMSKVNLNNIDYLGLDISEKAIEICNIKNKKNNLKFKIFDATVESIPKSDLIITKDLFLHLSFLDISKILDNIKFSGCKYFATSRYQHGKKNNIDSETGLGARDIEITKEPFNFNYPIVLEIFNTSLYSNKSWLNDKTIIFKLN